MQTKTIRKNIEIKLEEWLSSITDLQLRKELKSKILVSGGSITSMYFNEKVNDYDIYIMDKDVLVKLIDYYIKGHEVQVLEGWKKQKLLEDYTLGILKYDPQYQNVFTVAVDTLKENQVKLFMPKNPSGLKVEDKVANDVSAVGIIEQLKYRPKFFSPNAISLSDEIQIVVRFHGNAEEIHKTFDFVHATNYFTFAEGLVINKEALESLLTKQLKYQGSLYPLTTIIRIKKFLKRGWNISAGEMLKVMFQISEINLKDPNTLEEQLIGVDVAYFGKLIEILRGIDNPDITSSYLNEIIDRVFDGAEDTEQ